MSAFWRHFEWLKSRAFHTSNSIVLLNRRTINFSSAPGLVGHLNSQSILPYGWNPVVPATKEHPWSDENYLYIWDPPGRKTDTGVVTSSLVGLGDT